MADIFISAPDRSQVYRLPFLPESMPELSRDAQGEAFPTYSDGVYYLPGQAGPQTLALEGVLPGKAYPFAKSGVLGGQVIELLEAAMVRKTPVRLVLSGKKLVNLLVCVTSLTWHEQQLGDIAYSVEFTQYRRI